MLRITAEYLDLRLLGARLRELWPLEDASEFNDLVRALDDLWSHCALSRQQMSA